MQPKNSVATVGFWGILEIPTYRKDCLSASDFWKATTCGHELIDVKVCD